MNANDIKAINPLTKNSIAFDRIKKLCLDGSFNEIGEYVTDGEVPAQVMTGTAEIGSIPCMVFSQNSDVQDGAMSAAHCSKIIKCYEMAEKTGVPVIGIYDSMGAKLLDGVSSLDSYSSLLKMSSRLSGVVPQIAIIAGVCASSAAMLAMNADIIIALKDSQFFLNPPFNSDKTSGTAEDAVKNGSVHMVADTMEQAAEIVFKLLNVLPINNLSAPEYYPPELPVNNGDCIVSSLADADSTVEYMPDFGTAAKAFLGRIDGTSVGIVSTHGKINSDSSVKTAAFVRLCDSFSVPVVTLVNSEGFEDEGGKELRSVAKLTHAYSEATTVKLTVITEKAYGQAFVALCGKNSNSDAVIALEDATVSAVNPDAAVMLLMSDRLEKGEDRDELKKEYLKTEGSAYNAAAFGAIDKIVSKDELRATVSVLLDSLSGKRETTLARKHSNMPL